MISYPEVEIRALQERCERLRLALNIAIIHLHDEVFDWMMAELKPGDLADNLVAKSGADEGADEHG
jgi:hypothetical protein